MDNFKSRDVTNGGKTKINGGSGSWFSIVMSKEVNGYSYLEFLSVDLT